MPRRVSNPVLCCLFPLWLAGCATAASEAAAPQRPPVVSSIVDPCDAVSVPDYDPVLLRRAAVELEALPEGDPLAALVRDYGRMRDAVRACRSGAVPAG